MIEVLAAELMTRMSADLDRIRTVEWDTATTASPSSPPTGGPLQMPPHPGSLMTPHPGSRAVVAPRALGDPGEPIPTVTISGRPVDWPVDPGKMHFRLQDAYLGKLDLSCDTGYVVREYDFGFPAVRDVVYDNSLDDGTYDLTRYVGDRAVSLDIVLRPTATSSSLALVRSEPVMRDELLRFAHPTVRPLLVFSEFGDGDRVRYLMLRGADASYAVSQPRFNEISVSWRAPRAYIQSFDIIYARLMFAPEKLNQTYTVDVYNPGTAPAHWSMHVEGELSNPRITLNNPVDGNTLWVKYPLTLTGPSVDIDSYTKSVLVGGVLTGYRYLDDRSVWFRIPPGHSTLTLTHDGPARAGYPFARWQPDGGAPVRYLNTLIGTVTTPDPGQRPNESVLVWKVWHTNTTGTPGIAGQWEGASTSGWKVYRDTDGTMNLASTTAGVQTSQVLRSDIGRPLQTVNMESMAFSLTLNNGAGESQVRSWYSPGNTSSGAPTWTALGPTRSYPISSIFDSSNLLRIGQGFTGRIYSVELRHGTDPNDTTPYLLPAIGTVTTPDPGVLPNEFTLAWDVQHTSATGIPWTAAQFEGTDPRSWGIRRSTSNDRIYFESTADGVWSNRQGRWVDTRPFQTVSRERLAVSVTLNEGGQQRMQSWSSSDGSAWTPVANRLTGTTVTPFDVSTALRVGQDFIGRIHSVELRKGLDPVGAYLNPAVGTVTTPDPGPLPTQCTFIYTTKGPTPAGAVEYGTIVSQDGVSPQQSWVLGRADQSGSSPGGEHLWFVSADGTSSPTRVDLPAAPIDTGAPETFAVSINFAPTMTFQLWTKSAAGWTANGAPVTRPLITPFNSTNVLRIGAHAGGTAEQFNGSIYSVELRNGIDPTAGTTVWKFDAAEYPGTGTSYVDPRGRTWTLTTAAAISGQRLWKFDAAEYPGTGTSFVDPRGRTWTLTSANALIRPSVPIWKFNSAEYPGTGGSFTDPRGRTWTLTDATAISSAETSWAANSGGNPAPVGAPPWAWATPINPATGEPALSDVIFYLHPAWL